MSSTSQVPVFARSSRRYSSACELLINYIINIMWKAADDEICTESSLLHFSSSVTTTIRETPLPPAISFAHYLAILHFIAAHPAHSLMGFQFVFFPNCSTSTIGETPLKPACSCTPTHICTSNHLAILYDFLTDTSSKLLDFQIVRQVLSVKSHSHLLLRTISY